VVGPYGLLIRVDAPNQPAPTIEFVKINRAGEHQESSRDQLVALLRDACEPRACDDSGGFGADVIAALSYLVRVVDERL